jgi:NAD(P)-dependent dehydrogenase (short-subunit alcohol dehydrogenase family)
MERLLVGKTAIVTGSGGGAGRFTARSLASQGAQVVVNDVRDDAAESVAKEIRDEGGEAVAVTASVAEVEGAAWIIDTCIENFGRLDILVNNAAILRRSLICETPVEDWDAVIGVHLRGNFLCSRAAIPHMIGARRGRIINMTSTAALQGVCGTNAYAAAKGGITVLTSMLAKELVFYNITVNALELMGGGGGGSMIGSDPMSEMTQRVRLAHGWWFPPQPADAPPPPDDPIPTPLGTMVSFLASDDASYINGQILGVSQNAYRLWSYFNVDRTMQFEDGLTPGDLRDRFPQGLGQGMSNPIPELPELPT